MALQVAGLSKRRCTHLRVGEVVDGGDAAVHNTQPLMDDLRDEGSKVAISVPCQCQRDQLSCAVLGSLVR